MLLVVHGAHGIREVDGILFVAVQGMFVIGQAFLEQVVAVIVVADAVHHDCMGFPFTGADPFDIQGFRCFVEFYFAQGFFENGVQIDPALECPCR